MKQERVNQKIIPIIIKIIFTMFILNFVFLLETEVNAAIYGKDYFGEEYSNGFIKECFNSEMIRKTSGISVKTGKQINRNSTVDNYNKASWYTCNNTSKSEYIDYSNAARYINSNGEPIWLDMRIYIWTNNRNYPWAVSYDYLGVTNLFNGVIQHTNMEFHFYTAGHCGESNYEQSFKGVTCFSDLDVAEGIIAYSGYNQLYVQSGIPVTYIAKGNANSTSGNNPFSTTGTSLYSYVFGNRLNNNTDNVWVEINSTPSSPFRIAYGTRKDALSLGIGYIGTPIQYYINGILKDTYYCVPYGKYRLVDTSKVEGQMNNYTVDGWYTSTSYTTKASNGLAGTSTIKLYGRTFSNYTVKYNGNGATSGNTANSNHVYSFAKNLTLNGFQKNYTVTFKGNYEGAKEEKRVATYKFKNWDTKANGTGTKYNNGQSVINLTSTAGGTVNMYAIWEPESVSYVPEREGYSFQGWYLDLECTAKVSDNEYIPTKDTTLYAKWEKDYTITVDNSKDGHIYNSYQIFQGDYYEKEDKNGNKTPILSNIEWSKELQKEIEEGKTHGEKIIELLKENEKDKSESYKLYTNCKTAEDVAEVLKGMPNDGEVIREFTKIVGKYILENNIPITKGTSTLVEKKDENGNVIDTNYKITHLDPGYYLVIDAEANEKDDAYSRYLIDVVQDVTMEVKSSIPTLKKKVIGNNIKNQIEGTGTSEDNPAQYIIDDKHNTSTYKDASKNYNSADYDIEFELKSYIPNPDGYSTYKFEIVDILAKGFDLDNNSIKVYLGENEYPKQREKVIKGNEETGEEDRTEIVENYTINSIVITESNYETYKLYFEEEGKEYSEEYAESQYGKTLILIELNDLIEQIKDEIVTPGQDVFVMYNARLNGKGEVGNTPNINEAYLKYSNDPYHKEKITQTTTQTTYTYTIDLDVSKIAELKSEDSEKEYLSGAEFEIYSEPNTVEERTPIATITTDELGQVLYSSLGAGTYYLKEIKSPEGYNKLREEIEIEVSATCDEFGAITWSVEDKKDNGLVYTQIVEKEGSTIPEIKLQVENTSGFQLPVTGGNGRVVFTIIGLSIMLIAVKLNKKRN